MNEPNELPPLSPDRDTVQVFATLAETVYAGDDFTRVYDEVCAAASRVIPGCDHVSLMLRRRGRTITAAASDDVARQVDALERALGEGPCVDAIAEDSAYLDSDLTRNPTWPRLAERVLAETPVRGAAGFCLAIGPEESGALNMFSDTPGGLTEDSVHAGMMLASFVAVALYAAAQSRSATTLREGLVSNREIGKAVGLLMAFHKVSDEQAFELLRRASQDMNLKVADVAREVVQHHNDRGEAPPVSRA
jgi:hypothetical protein